MEELLDGRALVHAVAGFAAESASLAALQTLTKQMLVAADIDQARHAMLSGVTSGDGLAFNRAALFLLE